MTDRTAHRFKLYADYMKSLGIVQKDHEGYNNWHYQYSKNDSFWIVDLHTPEDKFKARIYDFIWKYDNGVLEAEDLYDEEGDMLIEYDPPNFNAFKKLLNEKLDELKKYDVLLKQHILEDKMNKIQKDF